MDIQEFFTNFLQSIGGMLPGVLGALAVLIIGWLVARMVRGLVVRLLSSTDLDNKLFRGAKSNISPEKFIAKLVYYILMLIVLMVVLEMLGVENVLDPLKAMVADFAGAIPRIVQAGIIGFAGYIIATIASEVLGFAGGTVDTYSEKMGLSNSIDLAKIVKQVVFLFVFIPILITAIDALGMRSISEPATNMLHSLFAAIPKILTAAIILGVFYIGGRMVTGIIADLLRNLGFDGYSSKLGLTSMMGDGQSLSSIVANVGFAFLMFTGIIQAVEILGFTQMTATLNNLLEMSGQIFFGLIIMAIGNFISTMASKAITDDFLSTIVRVTTMGLFLAIALRTMGIANDIVNMAFGLTLGAVAVAVALSFGLGGREAAGKQMEHILKKFRND